MYQDSDSVHKDMDHKVSAGRTLVAQALSSTSLNMMNCSTDCAAGLLTWHQCLTSVMVQKNPSKKSGGPQQWDDQLHVIGNGFQAGIYERDGHVFTWFMCRVTEKTYMRWLALCCRLRTVVLIWTLELWDPLCLSGLNRCGAERARHTKGLNHSCTGLLR